MVSSTSETDASNTLYCDPDKDLSGVIYDYPQLPVCHAKRTGEWNEKESDFYVYI